VTDSPDEPVQELISRWTAAEIGQDIDALDALAVEDFRLVGPAGFVLDKQQWLDRYRRGQLLTHSLTLGQPFTGAYGSVAVTIATQLQDAEYRRAPARGELRVTLITVRDDRDQLRLAGMHLSPTAAAFAGPEAA